jgi:hypothetical protein
MWCDVCVPKRRSVGQTSDGIYTNNLSFIVVSSQHDSPSVVIVGWKTDCCR